MDFSCCTIVSLDASSVLVGWGQRLESAEPNAYPSWYFPDFFLKHTQPFFSHEHTAIVTPQELLKCLPQESTSQKLAWSTPDWQSYESEFQKLQSEFEANRLNKAVPYVCIQAESSLSAYLPQSLRCALTYHLAHPETALIGSWGPGGGMLGVTPELFCRIRDRRLITMACAGTVSAKESERLLSDAKLIKEHTYVIEGIRQDLEIWGTVFMGKTEVRSFGRLAHLVTPIELESCDSLSLNNIIPSLHPTAALGAFPKQAGQVWLQQYAEKFPRDRYGAPVGVLLNESEGVMYVAIRSVFWKPEVISIFAGGGVLKESLFEEEKQELKTKLSAIREQLNV